MTQTTGLIAIFKAAPGRLDDLLGELEAMVDVAQQEAGTLAYGLHRIDGEADGVLVYELYNDAEARRVHGLSDAIAGLKQRLPPLLAASPELTPLTPVAGAKGLPF